MSLSDELQKVQGIAFNTLPPGCSLVSIRHLLNNSLVITSVIIRWAAESAGNCIQYTAPGGRVSTRHLLNYMYTCITLTYVIIRCTAKGAGLAFNTLPFVFLYTFSQVPIKLQTGWVSCGSQTNKIMLLKYKQDIEINLKLNTDVNKILFYEIMTGGQLANRHVFQDWSQEHKLSL